MKKGIIIFYVNYVPDSGVPVEDSINLIRNTNKELIEKLHNDGYDTLFVPTVKESSRVEKMDFDQPFPKMSQNSLCVNNTNKDD